MKPRTNDEWVTALKRGGDAQAEALADLRSYLLHAATYALHRAGTVGAEVAPVAEDCAQDALMSILAHVDDFRGESRFTTWAYVFAVNRALVAARRKRWESVPLDHVLDQAAGATHAAWSAPVDGDPQRTMLQSELMRIVRKGVDDALSPRQRQVLQAVVFDEVPLDEIVRRWSSNRNALYKLLHDARRKLRAYLEAYGFAAADLRALLDGER